jgi:phosphohistidine phosphatase
MLLYLLRHAIAEDNAATDASRDLTAQGLAQASSIKDKLSRQAPQMDKVLCSPYNRAQQTAHAVMTLFPDLSLTTEESIKPGGDVYEVMDAIEASDVQHLMLIGHNPFLSNLLSVLLDGTMNSSRHMGNATLHCISLDVVAPGCGEIVYTLEP